MPATAHTYYRLFFADYGGVGFIVCLYLALGIAEFNFPVEGEHRGSGRARNIVVTVLFLAAGLLLTKRIMHTVGLTGVMHDIELRRRHSPDRGVWFSIAIVLSYGFATDFLFYWYHRAQHKIDLLWPIHELHHTETELNATTSLRSYWLEAPLQAVLIGVPASLTVVDGRAFLFLPVVFTAWLFFAHTNWRLRLGFLTPFICGPQLHRIHHSNLPEHQNKNFAQFFPFIDILFGTYYQPGRDEFPATGIAKRTSPASPAEIVVGPFQAWAASLEGLLDKEPGPPRRAPARGARRPVRKNQRRRRVR